MAIATALYCSYFTVNSVLYCIKIDNDDDHDDDDYDDDDDDNDDDFLIVPFL